MPSDACCCIPCCVLPCVLPHAADCCFAAIPICPLVGAFVMASTSSSSWINTTHQYQDRNNSDSAAKSPSATGQQALKKNELAWYLEEPPEYRYPVERISESTSVNGRSVEQITDQKCPPPRKRPVARISKRAARATGRYHILPTPRRF